MNEYFDHVVRSERQLEHFRDYIASNPLLAHLPQGSFSHRDSAGNSVHTNSAGGLKAEPENMILLLTNATPRKRKMWRGRRRPRPPEGQRARTPVLHLPTATQKLP